MKKIIGLACWLLAFLLPFKYSILDTKEVIMADGRADNITGLLSFVAMLTLVFVGYWLVDSSKGAAPESAHGH